MMDHPTLASPVLNITAWRLHPDHVILLRRLTTGPGVEDGQRNKTFLLRVQEACRILPRRTSGMVSTTKIRSSLPPVTIFLDIPLTLNLTFTTTEDTFMRVTQRDSIVSILCVTHRHITDMTVTGNSGLTTRTKWTEYPTTHMQPWGFHGSRLLKRSI